MRVLIGKHCGFCFGVERAVERAKSLKGERNFVLGELIHNEKVNDELRRNGLKTVYDVNDSELKSGDTLLIRTHGEKKSTFDIAAKKGLNVIDCTCPFVKEIQKIVYKHYNDGYKILIVGNAEHPEIKGINGWCDDSAYIVSSQNDLPQFNGDKICVVVQTTYSEEKFDEIIKNFNRQSVKTVDIFKTICYTTTKRQKETFAISKLCDAVLVLGGANSNNTQELFDICKMNCEAVYKVSDSACFEYEKVKNLKRVGVVLGASTPIEQLREVISNMEKITEENVTTEVVESEEVKAPATEAVPETDVVNEVPAQEDNVSKSEMEKAFEGIKKSRDFKVGQVVNAKISSATDSGLTLSMNNAKKDFELPKDEILGDYDKAAYADKIGQDIRVMVVAKNPIKFSERAMEKVLKEEAEIEEIKNGKLFDAIITATNKGGLTGKFGSYEVFVPASQVRMGFVKDLEKYVGKTMTLKAEKVESRGSRRQIVGSRRVILEAEKQERDAIRAQREAEFFANIQEGDVVLGTPVRFAAFGAFIDVNGFDCLAHISDLSWTGCKDCSEVLEIGKQYEFKILKIDAENKRVSVGYKQLQPKPWDTVLERYHIGDVVKGKVVRIVAFGAFVEVEKGIDGLVHVSQISNQWLENPVTALEVGQEVEAKILDIIPEREKMTLSIKALLPEEPKPAKEENEKSGKGKRKAKEDNEEEFELREWKDDKSSGVSIADLLNNK